TFGGAQAAVAAAPGADDVASLTGEAPADLGLPASLGGGATPDTGTGGGSASVGGTGSTTGAGAVNGGSDSGRGRRAVGLDAVNASLGGTPVRPGSVVLGVIAAGLLAFGLRRLSDGVLAEDAMGST